MSYYGPSGPNNNPFYGMHHQQRKNFGQGAHYEYPAPNWGDFGPWPTPAVQKNARETASDKSSGISRLLGGLILILAIVISQRGIGPLEYIAPLIGWPRGSGQNTLFQRSSPINMEWKWSEWRPKSINHHSCENVFEAKDGCADVAEVAGHTFVACGNGKRSDAVYALNVGDSNGRKLRVRGSEDVTSGPVQYAAISAIPHPRSSNKIIIMALVAPAGSTRGSTPANTIDIFHHRVGTSELLHRNRLTSRFPLSDIAAIGEESFYATEFVSTPEDEVGILSTQVADGRVLLHEGGEWHTLVNAIASPRSIALGPNGRFVYVTSLAGKFIAVFERKNKGLAVSSFDGEDDAELDDGYPSQQTQLPAEKLKIIPEAGKPADWALRKPTYNINARFSLTGKIPLSFYPDKVKIQKKSGDLYVAGHPSMLHLMYMNKASSTHRSPSAVLSLSPTITSTPSSKKDMPPKANVTFDMKHIVVDGDGESLAGASAATATTDKTNGARIIIAGRTGVAACRAPGRA